MLILVRHATPDVVADTLPETWALSDDGHEAARSLILPAGALLVSSAEPKARQTLEPAGSVATDARFNEIRRREAFSDDFRTMRMRYVNGADHADWEPRDEVAARFGAGIAVWSERADRRSLVVASHGMAMTVWLTAAIGLRDPGAFWTDLRFPDVLHVDGDRVYRC